jgi:hypothetical protein
LDYPKCGLKVSYAGSFGLSSIDEEQREPIAELLRDFDYLSVRERQAASIIRDIADMDVPVVCDPTLLLDVEDWKALAGSAEKTDGYIFVYTVFNSDAVWQTAKELSAKTGLPIKTISYSKLHRHKAHYDFSAGPGQWLSYMANADYVVTNSFHGMAFSINFRKQFYYELPPKSSGVGSRLKDMAQKFDLTHREITCKCEEPINYSGVSVKMEQARAESLGFIKQFISD